MGLFSNQFANVVEWEEYRDDLLFWKWTNREIKKDSRLIIKPGQDAIFLYNGAVEGIFTESGSYTIDSDRSEERRVGKECRSRWSPYH